MIVAVLQADAGRSTRCMFCHVGEGLLDDPIHRHFQSRCEVAYGTDDREVGGHAGCSGRGEECVEFCKGGRGTSGWTVLDVVAEHAEEVAEFDDCFACQVFDGGERLDGRERGIGRTRSRRRTSSGRRGGRARERW